MPGHAFFWAELTTKDFEGLDPEKTIAVLPVAATEQHGPHLPVMTDTAIAEGMIALLQKRLPSDLRVLVLPIQSIGKSNEHVLSPGTLTLSAETLLRVLVETGESVHRAGVEKLVRFRNEDLFKANISEATVVTLYLLPDLNVKLMPRLMDQLKPGSRIVSHQFDMGDWRPDKKVELSGRTIYLWTIPSKKR